MALNLSPRAALKVPHGGPGGDLLGLASAVVGLAALGAQAGSLGRAFAGIVTPAALLVLQLGKLSAAVAASASAQASARATGAAAQAAALKAGATPAQAAAAGAQAQAQAGAGLSTLAVAGAAVTATAAAAAGAVIGLKALADVIVDLGGKASPVALTRYRLAVDDAQAVLGRVFVPALELLTGEVRLFGDALASVLPTTAEVRQALAPLGDALKDTRDVLAGLAPLFRDVVREGLRDLALALRALHAPLHAALTLARQAGLVGGAQLASSAGAAARPAEFAGPEEVFKKSFAAAFSAGIPDATQAAQAAQVQSASRLGEVVRLLQQLVSRAGGQGGGPGAGQVVRGVREGVGFAVDPAGSLVAAARRALIGF